MEQTLMPPPASLSAIASVPTTAPPPAPSTTYPDSLDSSPRSRNTDSWGEDNSLYPTNNGTTLAVPPAGLTKLRLMCSYGGHIVPRPHDKSLCYVGGDTRIVVVDRHTTLSDLTHRLSKILLRSSSSTSLSSTTASFTLKYQLPSEDLDSLISVTTDEDLENMIDEYERLNSSSDVSKSSRLRLFLFPTKPESVSSIGSLLENSTKSEDWFLNALNGTTSFSDTSSVNCLLGLDDDISVPEKKDASGKNPKGTNSGQDVHSVPDLERTSSFGSASSSPSLASLPPIKVHVDENQKVGGIEEQFSQMSVRQQQKVQDDVPAPAPTVVTGISTPVAASTDLILSDGRQTPAVVYNNNNNTPDQIQPQQVSDSGYVMSMSNPQVDQSQHPQMHHQQPQFIHTAVVEPQYIHHHHPSGAVPMASYYPIYPSQTQHHPHQIPLDQQNFVYYMPARQAPHGYNLQHATGYAEMSSAGATPLSHNQAYTTTRVSAQTSPKSDIPTQFVQVPSSQHQPQPQYVGYSQIHHPPQSVVNSGAGGNYGYEFTDPAQRQPMYYAAAQPLAPQSTAQYQTVTAESGSYLPAHNSTKQQGRS